MSLNSCTGAGTTTLLVVVVSGTAFLALGSDISGGVHADNSNAAKIVDFFMLININQFDKGALIAGCDW